MNTMLAFLSAALPANAEPLVLSYKGGQHRILPRDIVRLEADGNYTSIYLHDRARPILMARVLRLYEADLRPFGFIRIHRAHLINPLYIAGIEDGSHVVMADESQPEISRRKRKDVLDMLRNLLPAA